MYEEFTREQLLAGLKSLKLENADLQNTVQKLKREIKDLKSVCSSFESDHLSRKTVARRSFVH